MKSKVTYEDFLTKKKVPFIKVGSLILRRYNKIIIPLGPILNKNVPEKIDVKKVFRKLGGFLVWWSVYDEQFSESPWYGVIKKEHFEIEDYPSSNIRNQVRKGLSQCRIKPVEVSWLAEHGYEVYKNAVSRYKQGLGLISLDKYKAKITSASGFEELIHYWGIFIEEQLVGYAEIYCHEKQEANISEIKIDPLVLKQYPLYALIHQLSEEYLKIRMFEYLSDGYRSVYHETSIQELLIQKFGFRKVGLKLYLKIRVPFNLLIRALYPFRKWIKKITSIVAILTLFDIAKNNAQNELKV